MISRARIIAISAVVSLSLGAMAADVSGTWTGTFAVPGSDHKEPQFFTFKQDGKKLTGSGGPDAVEQYPIGNGIVEGDAVSFDLTTGDWTFVYRLKPAGEELNGELKLKSKEGDTRSANVTLRKLHVAASSEIEAHPRNAVQAIVAAFDNYPIVAIGEGHSLREVGDFYSKLVNDPGFQAKVNDIVIEFSSRLSQPILDRYISGEAVPHQELEQVWRNTTKVFAFESPVYAQLLTTIRDANRRLPPDRRIRVLGGDAPIDWTKVTTHERWATYQPNDVSFAEVIDEEVVERHRKALVIMGGSHVTKNLDPSRDPNTTMLIERKHPGSVYVVLLDQSKRGLGGNLEPPEVVPVPHRNAGDYSDALLYLGENLTWAQPDWRRIRADSAYMNELDRRAQIEWGCHFDLNRFINGQMPCP